MALADNLVAYYKLDGNSNDSVGSNNLTDTNVSYSTSYGIINQGGLYNTSNGYIASNLGLTSASTYSYSLWVKFSTITTNNTIFSNYTNSGANRAIYLITKSSSTIAIDNGSSSGTTTSIITGTWYHFVVIVNFSTSLFTLYKNGVQVSSNTLSGNTVDSKNSFSLGAINNSNGLPLNGYIDEAGVWSRALSTDEISQLYNSGAGIQYPFSVGSSNFFQLF